MITGELGAINSVAEPMKVVPKAITIGNAGTKFTHELPGHSVSVLRVKTK
jgi:alpha-L-arabinofuranosidase